MGHIYHIIIKPYYVKYMITYRCSPEYKSISPEQYAVRRNSLVFKASSLQMYLQDSLKRHVSILVFPKSTLNKKILSKIKVII